MSIPPKIQSTIEKLNTELNYIRQQTQSTGEELSDLFGRTLESKIGLENIIIRLEALL